MKAESTTRLGSAKITNKQRRRYICQGKNDRFQKGGVKKNVTRICPIGEVRVRSEAGKQENG